MKQNRESSGNGDRLEGRYANYFQVEHNAFEFVFDFGQFYPENQEARFHTRVVTGPAYAKALLEALRESVQEYEKVSGVILTDEEGNA